MQNRTYGIYLSNEDINIIGKAADFIAFKILTIKDEESYIILRELITALCENYLNIGVHLGKSNPDRFSIRQSPSAFMDLVCFKTGKPIARLAVRGLKMKNVFFCETCNEFHNTRQIRKIKNAAQDSDIRKE